MFADLVGSTLLSSRLDPEDMREIIGAYHRYCAEQITKAGGFVAKYMGDGVLAYFGYPAAHEDDAERAVRAGLELIAAPSIRGGRRKPPPRVVAVGSTAGTARDEAPLTFVGEAGVGLRAMRHAGVCDGCGGHSEEDDGTCRDLELREGLEHGAFSCGLRGLSL
jgi:hypothetical protein